MRIEKISARVFRYPSLLSRDSAGHAHPAQKNTESMQALLIIQAEDGTEGVTLAPPEVVRPFILDSYARKVMLGQDIFHREKIWFDLEHFQRGSAGQFSDRALAYLDQALWDLIGKKLNTPVYKLLGGYRDSVPAYGSTMCGDQLEGGLSTPAEYAEFAVQLVQKGYKAIKLHTWMPPVSFAPSVEMDIRACEAVREAVGPEIELMLDGFHWYNRMDALKIGKALSRLNFSWFEEMMNESNVASYAWLRTKVDVPIIGPESAAGKHWTRAEWIKNEACDILRAGSLNMGGISPTLKAAHLAEAFGMDCEIHGSSAANLSLAAAIKNCRWYERGLLHPFIDYDIPPPYLNSLWDPMDSQGNVHLSQKPGLGEDINWNYVEANTVEIY